MKRLLPALVFLVACNERPRPAPSQEVKDVQTSKAQQSQYGKAQPVPTFDWSLERDLVIQLYKLRNDVGVATHSVWRSDTGLIEYDCPSMGYGIPYDTSLTNPQQAVTTDEYGRRHLDVGTYPLSSLTSIGQAEPNGIFASTNTAATWVMCIAPGGVLEPHYIEAKVTVFPYPLEVDYKANRVYRVGSKSSASITLSRGRM